MFSADNSEKKKKKKQPFEGSGEQSKAVKTGCSQSLQEN